MHVLSIYFCLFPTGISVSIDFRWHSVHTWDTKYPQNKVYQGIDHDLLIQMSVNVYCNQFHEIHSGPGYTKNVASNGLQRLSEKLLVLIALKFKMSVSCRI